MAVREPQSANDYDDRTTEAVKSVLIEIGQILGSFAGKFAVVGVPRRRRLWADECPDFRGGFGCAR